MLSLNPLVDNSEWTLEDTYRKVIPDCEEIRIAIGYFDLSGFDLIKEDLENLDDHNELCVGEMENEFVVLAKLLLWLQPTFLERRSDIIERFPACDVISSNLLEGHSSHLLCTLHKTQSQRRSKLLSPTFLG
ncbi:hypothetical protein IL252_11255 [Halomicrobium sp. IBSBa]|uniref:hypothetical protein n=1 Tax=Halomicrobium sp. IBSBa TaxID=2778916 RepID=UPI001ABF2D8C|nr:hypothetical protein [Halomicrobium sp. IBSBa]MBO4248391.1 hypothetical protein [Halomicrobium sp. IBSBa]